MTVYNDTIFVGIDHGLAMESKIYKSTNYGEDWLPIADSTNGLTMRQVNNIAVHDSIIVAATSSPNWPYGLFISTNYGKTWEQINYSPFRDNRTNVLLIDKNKIFVGNNLGLYLSADFGESWLMLKNYSIYDMLIKDNETILAINIGVAISFDYQKTW